MSKAEAVMYLSVWVEVEEYMLALAGLGYSSARACSSVVAPASLRQVYWSDIVSGVGWSVSAHALADCLRKWLWL